MNCLFAQPESSRKERASKLIKLDHVNLDRKFVRASQSNKPTKQRTNGCVCSVATELIVTK